MRSKKVGIVSCSNGQMPDVQPLNEAVRQALLDMGMEVHTSGCMYQTCDADYADGPTRAAALMAMYRDNRISDIFDISGGDLGNDVLDYLDYETIAASPARFWGYSDLSTVINSIYTKTGKPSVLYQIKNLVREESGTRLQQFRDWHEAGSEELFDISCRFLRGDRMEGIVVGGNIRCLLKLAGTPYFPDMTGKILLLEALGGQVPQMTAHLAQLRQLGVFEKIAGILLGTFSVMEGEKHTPTMEELTLRMTPAHLPIVKTEDVGHYRNAKAVIIGKHYHFEA